MRTSSGYISPEQFDILLSIEFLIMVIIGGLGSIHGAVFGAIFVVVLPQLIILAKPYLPAAIAGLPILDAAAFGLIVILFVIFEPGGVNGYWIRTESLVRSVSVHPPRFLQPRQDRRRRSREALSEPMALFEVQDLSIAFGGSVPSMESASASTAVPCSPSSGRMAQARRRSSISSAASCSRLAGRIVFDGREITRMPAHVVARLGIGRTFQNIELFDNASVAAEHPGWTPCAHQDQHIWRDVSLAVRRPRGDRRAAAR